MSLLSESPAEIPVDWSASPTRMTNLGGDEILDGMREVDEERLSHKAKAVRTAGILVLLAFLLAAVFAAGFVLGVYTGPVFQ